VGASAEPELAQAAIEATHRYPSAIPDLGGWVVDPARPTHQRVAAAAALGRSGLPEGGDRLQDALRRRLPAPVRAAVASALAAGFPSRISPDAFPPATDGSTWLAVGASGSLAYAMGAAGYVAQPELGVGTGELETLPPLPLWAIGATTGAVAGASLGWLWGRAWPMEAGDGAFVATTVAGATAGGVLIGFGALQDPEPEIALGIGLGTQLVGLGAALPLRKVYDGTPYDSLEAAGFAVLAGGASEAWSTYAVANGGEPRRAGITGAAVIGGLAVGHLLAPRVDVVEGGLTIASGATIGVGAGLLVPIGDRPRSTLPLALGLGGAGVGAVVSAFVDVPQELAIGGATGGVLGAGVLGGVGLLVDPDGSDVAGGLALAGLTLGVGAGAAISALDPDPIDSRDVAVSVAAASWGAWDAVAIAALADLPTRQGSGLVLISTAAAGGSFTAANLALDVPVPHTLAATSIGLWAGYAGAAIGELAQVPKPVALALPASNLGLLGGALAVSPRVGVPPLVVGIADGFGVIGASLGAIGAGLASDDERVVVGASLAGTALGLTGGAIVGQRWHQRGDRRDLVRIDAPLRLPPIALMPLPVAGGFGVAAEVSGW
jgi:hypothetical protein